MKRSLLLGALCSAIFCCIHANEKSTGIKGVFSYLKNKCKKSPQPMKMQLLSDTDDTTDKAFELAQTLLKQAQELHDRGEQKHSKRSAKDTAKNMVPSLALRAGRHYIASYDNNKSSSVVKIKALEGARTALQLAQHYENSLSYQNRQSIYKFETQIPKQ